MNKDILLGLFFVNIIMLIVSNLMLNNYINELKKENKELETVYIEKEKYRSIYENSADLYLNCLEEIEK